MPLGSSVLVGWSATWGSCFCLLALPQSRALPLAGLALLLLPLAARRAASFRPLLPPPPLGCAAALAQRLRLLRFQLVAVLPGPLQPLHALMVRLHILQARKGVSFLHIPPTMTSIYLLDRAETSPHCLPADQRSRWGLSAPRLSLRGNTPVSECPPTVRLPPRLLEQLG
jgi:hypothetical protein